MLLCAAFGIGGAFFVGCEKATGTRWLTVSPSTVDLTSGVTNSATLTFTVTAGLGDLSLPLVWSVSDPTLGVIGSSGGLSASYVGYLTAPGYNAIHVKDQYGAEGVATVRQ